MNSCGHARVYDSLLADGYEPPVIAIRQCCDCRSWWKVYDAEHDETYRLLRDQEKNSKR